jgi:hypothetical protein
MTQGSCFLSGTSSSRVSCKLTYCINRKFIRYIDCYADGGGGGVRGEGGGEGGGVELSQFRQEPIFNNLEKLVLYWIKLIIAVRVPYSRKIEHRHTL